MNKKTYNFLCKNNVSGRKNFSLRWQVYRSMAGRKGLVKRTFNKMSKTSY